MSGQLPAVWKLEHHVLLPKIGKVTYECSAYRTVSLTDCLGKRMEKIIKRLVGILDINGFDDNQFAYLKHRSATQAVLALAKVVKRNILNKRLTGAVFFDLKDAFGSVNRRKLLYKLCLDFQVSSRLLMYNTIQYNNGIYRALFTKRSGALTQLAVICSAKKFSCYIFAPKSVHFFYSAT